MNRGSNHSAFPRRAIGWTIAVGLIIAASIWAIFWGRSYQKEKGAERCREPVEALEGSRRIARYFSDHRMALSEGLIDLDRTEPATLEGNLRILERILEDDGLLEAEVHRGRTPVPGRRASFSAHDWIVGEEGRPVRSRLPGLLLHPSLGARSQAASCLAYMGAKLPEALASEPLPWFRREHLQAVLVLLGGNPPRPDPAVRTFLREILQGQGTLRLWESGPAPGRQEVQSLALRAVLALDDPIGGALIEAVRTLKELAVPDRALQARILGRSGDPEAWPLLVQLSGKEQPAAVRTEALAALQVSAPVDAIPPLKEMAGSGDAWGEKIRDVLEHISGERIPDRAPPKLEPGRLGALRAAPQTRTEAARQISALRFHGLTLEPASKNLEARRRVVALLASPFPESRLEAARTVGRAGIVEAIGGGGAGAAGAAPLLGLLLDSDFRIASAAATALFEITAFWPLEDRSIESPEPGVFSLAAASDPSRVRRWAAAFQNWWTKEGGRRREDWLLDGLESLQPSRASRGARGLAELEARGQVDASWYQRNAARITQAFPRLPAEARAPVLQVIAAREVPARVDVLWGLFTPAFRADPVSALEILGAVQALLGRGAGAGAGEKAVLAALVARISREEGSPEVLISGYLDARFPASRIDDELLAAIRALAGGAEKEAARARLVRFFPRAADRTKVVILADLLLDPGPRTRFWAFQRLSALAGQDFGYDPQKSSADQAVAIGKFKAWAESYAGSAPQK